MYNDSTRYCSDLQQINGVVVILKEDEDLSIDLLNSDFLALEYLRLKKHTNKALTRSVQSADQYIKDHVICVNNMLIVIYELSSLVNRKKTEMSKQEKIRKDNYEALRIWITQLRLFYDNKNKST